MLRVVSWDGGGSGNVIGGVEQSSGHLDIGNSIKFRIYYFKKVNKFTVPCIDSPLPRQCPAQEEQVGAYSSYPPRVEC